MNRPTTKQIDQWLAGIASRTPIHSPESEEMGIGLAAEVRALQAELSETKAHLRSALDAGEAAERRVVELRDQLETARSAARHHADERAKLIDRLKRTDAFGGME